MSFCLILLAAGESKRFGSKTPKPFIKVGEKTLLEHSLLKFNKVKQIKKIIVVINKKHKKFFNQIKESNFYKVVGGETRQISTYRGLNYIKKKGIKCSNILIHDAARPNFSVKLIKKIIKNSKKYSVIPKISINDALKKRTGKKIILSLPRESFFNSNTSVF